MSIIVCMAESGASICAQAGDLAICFEDPAYIRAEQVLVDAQSRHIGLVFEQGYHDLGLLPEGLELGGVRLAHLSGTAHALSLTAPVKFIQ